MTAALITSQHQKSLGHVADLLDVIFPIDIVKSALLLALFSTWIVAGLFVYLNRRTHKSYFSLWTVSWMFYAVFLAAAIALEALPVDPWFLMLRRACIGISALFMAWGSFALKGRPRSLRELGGGCILIALWSFTVASFDLHVLWVEVSVFALLAWASVYTGLLYLRDRQRYQSAAILAVGFVLLGGYLLAFPFLDGLPRLMAVGYYLSALLSLFIAMGMMIQSLEQARERNEILIGEFKKGSAQRRILRQEAAVTEQKYRALFDTASDAIFLVDVETQKILEANEAAGRLTGHTADNLIARSFTDLCPHLREASETWSDPKRVVDLLLRTANDFAIVRADGTRISCDGNANLVHVNSRPVLQLNAREVTERKRMEQQMRQVEKLSALGKLIAGVAHELNNPLAVVIGYAQILGKKTDLDPHTSNTIKKMHHECERASKIVRNLLTFARPREPHMSPVDINRIVSSVCELRETELQALNIKLIRRLTPATLRTMADALQIEQVFTNVFMNAIQALSGWAGNRVLEIATRQDGAAIRISIADNGPGIPANVLGRVFDPFFSTKGPDKGTGLGLSICYSIMEEHRGKIWVESEPGKGANFIIELPLVACPEHDENNPHDYDSQPPDPHEPKRRLLVVDDEPGIIEILKEGLTSLGFVVESATNGVAAIAAIAAANYDLIITDLCMPEMDGKDLYRAIKQSKPAVAERFMFVTGDTMNPESREFLEKTRQSWINKPFQLKEIVNLINCAIQNAGSPALSAGRSPA